MNALAMNKITYKINITCSFNARLLSSAEQYQHMINKNDKNVTILILIKNKKLHPSEQTYLILRWDVCTKSRTSQYITDL